MERNKKEVLLDEFRQFCDELSDEERVRVCALVELLVAGVSGSSNRDGEP